MKLKELKKYRRDLRQERIDELHGQCPRHIREYMEALNKPIDEYHTSDNSQERSARATNLLEKASDQFRHRVQMPS